MSLSKAVLVNRNVLYGQCRLCLNHSCLQESHFIPQGAYKRIRGKGKNPDPIHIRDGRAIQTSKQTTAPLLCYDCEQRFSKNGEKAFFLNCYQGPGEFPLLEILRQQNPLTESNQFAAHAVPADENSMVEKIGYMGLSILWKSAAHTWRDRCRTIPSISLGSPYQEQVRQFLLNERHFPENAAMIVEVSDENNRMIAVLGTPLTSKWSTHYLHWMDICGIRFNLLVGKRMPPEMKGLCVFKPGQKFVLVAKQQEAIMAKDYRKLLEVLAERATKS